MCVCVKSSNSRARRLQLSADAAKVSWWGRREEEEEKWGGAERKEVKSRGSSSRWRRQVSKGLSVSSQPQRGFCSLGVNNAIMLAAERERERDSDV